MSRILPLAGIVVLPLLAGLAGPAAAERAAGLTLQGRVASPEGKPIAGARVYVYTAQPRVGIGSACPSCYPECGKTVLTDSKGRFTIAGLGDGLLFRLLFVADGRVPLFHDKVDPLSGPLEQVLRGRDSVLAPGLRTTTGHVVDAHGEPVAGASVFTRGIQTTGPYGDGVVFGDFNRMNARIDPVAVTDSRGEFHLAGPDSIRAWVLYAEARNLSPRVFPDISAGRDGGLLRLDAGAVVTGIVQRDGRPVPGAVIGLAQVDRNMESSVDPDTIACDDRGRFTFMNVPPEQDYAFTGVVGSMGPWALRTVVRTVGDAESTTMVPPLALERGFRLQGRVSLSDRKSIPAGTELVIGRAFSAGPMVVPMDEDGRFEVEGLPPETIMLRIRLRGYHIVPTTKGYAGKRQSAVRLAMLHDRKDVEIVLEPDPPAPAATTTGGSPRP